MKGKQSLYGDCSSYLCTGEVIVVLESNYDIELGYPYFANKARGAAKQMWDTGDLSDEKFLAWF